MRPSPGVTVLQYFLISSAQEFSSFVASAANFCWIAFVISACADAGLDDKMTSNGTNPRPARKCTVFFIDRPLITHSEPLANGFCRSRGRAAQSRELSALRRAPLLMASLRQCKREARYAERKIDPNRSFDREGLKRDRTSGSAE